MKSKYGVGDLVVLKSGGPVMTVQMLDPTDRSIQCQWFSGKKLESGWFPPESLKEPEEKVKE